MTVSTSLAERMPTMLQDHHRDESVYEISIFRIMITFIIIVTFILFLSYSPIPSSIQQSSTKFSQHKVYIPHFRGFPYTNGLSASSPLCHQYPLSSKAILQCHFESIMKQYPRQLTWHPQVDCNHGRYLVIDNWLTDGYGSTLATYANILAIAIYFNLTLVEVPMQVDHAWDESDLDRRQYLGIHDFDLARSSYDQCPDDSPVKHNTFNVSQIGSYWTYEHSHLKMGSNLFGKLDVYLSSISTSNRSLNGVVEGVGATIVNRGHTGWWGLGLSIAGLVMETRYHVLHPFLPRLTGSPSNDEYKAHVLSVNQDTRIQAYPKNDSLMVAIHIRRGDLTVRRCCNGYGEMVMGLLKDKPNDWKNRMINDQTIANLVGNFHLLLPEDIRSRLHYTVYSEGYISDFTPLTRILTTFGITQMNYILNGKTTITMNAMVRADVFFGTLSAFSFAVLSMNTHSLRIMPVWGTLPERFLHSRGLIDTEFTSEFPQIETVPNSLDFYSLDTFVQSWKFKNETNLVERVLELIQARDQLHSVAQPFSNLAATYNDVIYPHNRILGHEQIYNIPIATR